MIDYSHLSFRIEPMTLQDIPALMQIEAVSFSAPWSARAYDYELRYNEMARYYVARPQGGDVQPLHRPQGQVLNVSTTARQSWWQRLFVGDASLTASTPLVGYAGFWLMADEAHISTIATHPQWRRRGIAELLLIAMTEGAAEIGARMMTLEVRASNVGAQALYRKYGFETAGTRMNYYSDNGENALIMTTPRITTVEYQRKMQGLKAALFARLSR